MFENERAGLTSKNLNWCGHTVSKESFIHELCNNISAEGRIADALKYGFLDLDEEMLKGTFYTFFFSANSYDIWNLTDNVFIFYYEIKINNF